MKVELKHRHYGIHELLKEIEIKGKFSDYCTCVNPENKNINNDDYNINEEKLISNLPKDFIPVNYGNCLLSVDSNKGWSVGQINLSRFLNWSKYFDSYAIVLYKDL